MALFSKITHLNYNKTDRGNSSMFLPLVSSYSVSYNLSSILFSQGPKSLLPIPHWSLSVHLTSDPYCQGARQNVPVCHLTCHVLLCNCFSLCVSLLTQTVSVIDGWSTAQWLIPYALLSTVSDSASSLAVLLIIIWYSFSTIQTTI